MDWHVHPAHVFNCLDHTLPSAWREADLTSLFQAWQDAPPHEQPQQHHQHQHQVQQHEQQHHYQQQQQQRHQHQQQSHHTHLELQPEPPQGPERQQSSQWQQWEQHQQQQQPDSKTEPAPEIPVPPPLVPVPPPGRVNRNSQSLAKPLSNSLPVLDPSLQGMPPAAHAVVTTGIHVHAQDSAFQHRAPLIKRENSWNTSRRLSISQATPVLEGGSEQDLSTTTRQGSLVTSACGAIPASRQGSAAAPPSRQLSAAQPATQPVIPDSSHDTHNRSQTAVNGSMHDLHARLSSSGHGHIGALDRRQTMPLPVPQPEWAGLAQGLEQDLVGAIKPRRSPKQPDKPPAVGVRKVKRVRCTDTRHIVQLEQAMQAKLALATELSIQVDHLRRKERLLEMSVTTHVTSLDVVKEPCVDVKLQGMLQRFRHCYTREAIHAALARTAHVKHGRDVTIDMFGSCWLACVRELSELLTAHQAATSTQAQQEIDKRIQAVVEPFLDFLMAVAVDNHGLMVLAQEMDLVTGEHMPQRVGVEFWGPILDRLELTNEQIQDMLGMFDMWHRCLEHIMEERRAIKKHMATLASVASKTSGAACLLEMPMRMEAEQQALIKLMGNIARGSQLHILLHFLASRTLTPRQMAQLCVHGSPCFTNHHLNVAYLKVKHSAPDDPHRAMAESMLRRPPPKPAAEPQPDETSSKKQAP